MEPANDEHPIAPADSGQTRRTSEKQARSLVELVTAVARGERLTVVTDPAVQVKPGPHPMRDEFVLEHMTGLLMTSLGLLEPDTVRRGQTANVLLVWTDKVLELPGDEGIRRELLALLAHIGRHAARTAVQIGAHQQTPAALLAALNAAVASRRLDQRAWVLADIAHCLVAAGYGREAIRVAALGENEYVSDEPRGALQHVRAEAERTARRTETGDERTKPGGKEA